MPSRITDQLRAMGCTFYEDFRSPSIVRSNRDPTVSGDCLKDGYFEGGSSKYLSYDPATWPFREGAGTLFFEAVVTTNLGDTRIFSSDHTSGVNYEFAVYGTSTILRLDVGTGAGVQSSYNIPIDEFYGTTTRFLAAWTWEYTGGNTYIYSYLNGKYLGSVNAAFRTTNPDTSWDLGRYGANYFDGEVYNAICFQDRLSDGDIAALSKDYLHHRTFDAVSVLTMPMREVKINATGKTYTPITGTTTETEALLGSDGVTTSEFPTPLPGGGFSFDGDDQITIADADEFTFSTPGGGDKPFTVCVYFKTGNPNIFSSVVSKWTAPNDSEWAIFQNASVAKLSFYLGDLSTSGLIFRTVDSVLISGIAETWVITYDGSGSNAGITIYRGGSLAASTAGTSGGVYTQMRNSSNVVSIGGYVGGRLPAGSEIYPTPQIYPYEFNATEALLWHEKTVGEFSGSIIAEVSEKKAVAALPMTEVLINDSGAAYTPIVGSATGKQALLGSDGLTASEMPTKLPYGGFSFDGGDWITIPDSDEYTFADDNGDKPFSVCVYFKPSNILNFSGIVAKYQSGSLGEWMIYQTGTGEFRFYLVDQSSASANYITVNALLISELPETWVATYDGSGSTTGQNVYRNGLLAPSTATPGAYTQMRNSTKSLDIGKYATVNYLPNGSEIYLVQIVPFEMSPAQAKAWDRYAKSLRRGR
jgi:hypothetical protein